MNRRTFLSAFTAAAVGLATATQLARMPRIADPVKPPEPKVQYGPPGTLRVRMIASEALNCGDVVTLVPGTVTHVRGVRNMASELCLVCVQDLAINQEGEFILYGSAQVNVA